MEALSDHFAVICPSFSFSVGLLPFDPVGVTFPSLCFLLHVAYVVLPPHPSSTLRAAPLVSIATYSALFTYI